MTKAKQLLYLLKMQCSGKPILEPTRALLFILYGGDALRQGG